MDLYKAYLKGMHEAEIHSTTGVEQVLTTMMFWQGYYMRLTARYWTEQLLGLWAC